MTAGENPCDRNSQVTRAACVALLIALTGATPAIAQTASGRVCSSSTTEAAVAAVAIDGVEITPTVAGDPAPGRRNHGDSQSWISEVGSAITAFGDFGETNSTSLNAFINPTLGGIAFGEVFHRAAWLVRTPTMVVQIGRRRLGLDKFLRAVDLEEGICWGDLNTPPLG